MTTPAPDRDSVDAVIGENVHALLWHRRTVQRAFAASLGISPSVLSKRLRGTSAWSAADVALAAGLLGVAPGRLYEKPPTRTKVAQKFRAIRGEGLDTEPRRGHLRAVGPR